MSAHHFILQPYKGPSSRYTCPRCQKARTFVRYVDRTTGEPLADDVGRCNREIECKYHFTPKQYFEAQRPTLPTQGTTAFPLKNNRSAPVRVSERVELLKPNTASFIPIDAFKQSLQDYQENHLVQFLATQFGAETTSALISRYFIGTSKHWKGATVFWEIDSKGQIRTGKIMLYSPKTGRRSKDPQHAPYWVHRALKLPDFNLRQCFFGEHLLPTEPLKPVAVVESEKTALIASVYFPQFVWLACGSLTGLTPDKCKVLQGKNVVLFPDLNAFGKWQLKAKALSCLAHFMVSDLLERKANASEKAQGLDLADYLLRFPVSVFHSRPLHLHSNHLVPCGETRTGKDFNELIIASVWNKATGKHYRVLFSKDGSYATVDEAIEPLCRFFELEFQHGKIDDDPCLIQAN